MVQECVGAEEGVWEGWCRDEDRWEVGKEEWMCVGWRRRATGWTGGGVCQVCGCVCPVVRMEKGVRRSDRGMAFAFAFGLAEIGELVGVYF